MSDMATLIRQLQMMQQIPTMRGTDYAGGAANQAYQGKSIYSEIKGNDKEGSEATTTPTTPATNTSGKGGANGGSSIYDLIKGLF